MYEILAKQGYDYGPTLQVINRCSIVHVYSIGDIKTEKAHGSFNQAMFDGVLQFILWVANHQKNLFKPDMLLLPTKIDEIDLKEPMNEQCIVKINHEDIKFDGKNLTADVTAYTQAGNCAFELKGVTFVMISRHLLTENPNKQVNETKSPAQIIKTRLTIC